MDFSTANLVSVNNILSDVLIALNDEEMVEFSKGFYTSQIQQALQELSFDSFFLELYEDFDFPTDTLTIPLPEGAFNLRQVFVFNGDDEIVKDSANVWIKSGYITKGAGKGHTARNKEGDTNDPFIQGYKNLNNGSTSQSEPVLFCSIQNGNIMFSSSCSSYQKVRLEYNGVKTNLGEVPLIPIQFREAVKLWVEVRCLKYLSARKPRFYMPLYRNSYQELYTPYSGVWDMAKQRASNANSKEMQDLKEYLSKMNY